MPDVSPTSLNVFSRIHLMHNLCLAGGRGGPGAGFVDGIGDLAGCFLSKVCALAICGNKLLKSRAVSHDRTDPTMSGDHKFLLKRMYEKLWILRFESTRRVAPSGFETKNTQFRVHSLT